MLPLQRRNKTALRCGATDSRSRLLYTYASPRRACELPRYQVTSTRVFTAVSNLNAVRDGTASAAGQYSQSGTDRAAVKIPRPMPAQMQPLGTQSQPVKESLLSEG